MSFFNRKKAYSYEYEQLVRKVEHDVYNFVVKELITYKQKSSKKSFGDSVIVNIALFDLAALNYNDGVAQMENLLTDHINQLVNRRMKQLLHTLYIRYGIECVNMVANKSLEAMVAVYDLNVETISSLDEKYNIFWLVPFVREAYFSAIQGTEPESEEDKFVN